MEEEMSVDLKLNYKMGQRQIHKFSSKIILLERMEASHRQWNLFAM